MGIYEFNQLGPDDQANLLWEHGTFLMNRLDDKHIFNLYSLSDFYVEVCYDNKSNSISRIRTFKIIGALEPYLNLVRLHLNM